MFQRVSRPLRRCNNGEQARCPYEEYEKLTDRYTDSNLIYFESTLNDLNNPVIFYPGGPLSEVSKNIDIIVLAIC